MKREDELYNTELIEDRLAIVAVPMLGEGFSLNEMAWALLGLIGKTAAGLEGVERERFIEALEVAVEDLRNATPHQLDAERLMWAARTRLEDKQHP